MLIRSAPFLVFMFCPSLAWSNADPIDVLAWGARINAGEGPNSESSVCDLEPGQRWVSDAQGRGYTQSADETYHISVELDYWVQPGGVHEVQAVFESSIERLGDFTVSQGWAARYMVQFETDTPVRFETEVSSTLSPGANDAQSAVGVFIQTGLQSWVLFNRCPLDDYPHVVNPWEADTSVLQIVQYDIHADQHPYEIRIGDGVDYAKYGDYLTQSGIGLSSGTIQPGIYTVYLFSAGESSTEQNHTGEGALSLRPIPTGTGCVADLDASGTLDETDVMLFLSQRPDLNADLRFDFFDVSLFIESFTSNCVPRP